MKRKIFLIIYFLLFGICVNAQNQAENSLTTIELKNWKKTPVISGRVATEDDMKSGVAVFYLKDAGENHSAYNVELPKLAYLTNTENDSRELIIMIQVENTKQGIIVGYREPNGESGACFLNELLFLNEMEVEKLTNGSK